MAAAHWRPQMWQTWSVLAAALFMNWFSWSATMQLFSNSETPAKQVRRHEDVACAAVSQVVRSVLHRLRFDFRKSLNCFIGSFTAGRCHIIIRKNKRRLLLHNFWLVQINNSVWIAAVPMHMYICTYAYVYVIHMYYRFILVSVWSHDCSAVLLLPDKSRPPLPVYVNSSPSSYTHTVENNLQRCVWSEIIQINMQWCYNCADHNLHASLFINISMTTEILQLRDVLHKVFHQCTN